MVPVPVKRSTLTALHKKDERFNLEVDLGRIGTFSNAFSSRSPSTLLYCDLQVNLDANVARRLGSGRSGFYRGHYLKGVGRTPLAANWNDPDDLYHNSGLQIASSAVREYVLTAFLAAQGKSHLVQGCTGVLFRPLPPSFRDHARRVFRRAVRKRGLAALGLPLVDFHLQAVTVKRGDFSRFSNFVWWLQHLPLEDGPNDGSPIGRFFEALHAALNGAWPDGRQPGLQAGDVAVGLAGRCKDLVDRVVEAWSFGIDWGSLHNNYSIDGRFLDLETPTVFPCPAFGPTSTEPRARRIWASHFGDFLGFRGLRCVRAAMLFVAFLRQHLRFIITSQVRHPLEVAYIEEFLESLDACIGRAHPLGSLDALSAAFVTPMAGVLHLGHKDRARLEQMFRVTAAHMFPQQARRSPVVRPVLLRRLDLPVAARCEPHQRSVAYVPDFARDACAVLSPASLEFNRVLEEADAITDVDTLLGFLGALSWRAPQLAKASA